MNLKVIINAIIIVAILHMLIINIDYHEVIGMKKMENYDNRKDMDKKDEDTLNFLNEEDDENSEINSEGDLKEQLLNYVKKEHFSINEKASEISNKVEQVLPEIFIHLMKIHQI